MFSNAEQSLMLMRFLPAFLLTFSRLSSAAEHRVYVPSGLPLVESTGTAVTAASLAQTQDSNGLAGFAELKAIDISHHQTEEIKVENVRCLVEDHEVRHIIVRAAIADEESGNNLDTSRKQLETLRQAKKEGLNFSVDLYLYVHWPPNLYHTTPVRDQVREAIALLEELDPGSPPLAVNRLWIDLEEAPPADQRVETTISLIQDALDECGPFPCGIYTGKNWWETYTRNTTAFSTYPLWYANPDCDESFDDWPGFAFGGWTAPRVWVKQYDFGGIGSCMAKPCFNEKGDCEKDRCPKDVNCNGHLCSTNVDYDIIKPEALDGGKQGPVNVTWQNVNQVRVSGNSLTNTAATGWSGAGANSIEKIESGNGHVEWTAGNDSTRRFVGLSTGPLDADHSGWDMRGHIEMGDDGWAWAGETGDPYGPGTNCGPYTDTTAFKVAIEGTQLKYYVGGSLCRTVTPTFTYPYYADVEMYTNEAPVNNVKLGGASCTPSCWSGCGGESNGCGGTCPDTGACTNVAWTNVVGVSANGNNLAKDGGTNGDNAGANSVAALSSGNAYLEFQAGATDKRMWVGLGKAVNQSAWDLEFHFDLGTDAAIWAGEMGEPYGPGTYCGNYTTNTRFKIEVLGGNVKYYKDGTLCRITTGATIPYPLYADNSLDTVGAVLSSVRTSGFSGEGVTSKARGFDPTDLTASYYDGFNLTGFVLSEPWTGPIDFLKTCFGEPFPFEGCKLYPALEEGANYSASWEGTLIIPIGGDYTFRLSKVDDEARLLVELGGILTNVLSSGGASPNPAPPVTVSLAGPTVPVRVEFKQFVPGAASLTLHWQGPGFVEEVVPLAGAGGVAPVSGDRPIAVGRRLPGPTRTDPSVQN